MMIKVCAGIASEAVSDLIGHALPTRLGRYVAPTIGGALVGGVTGRYASDDEHKTRNMLLGGVLGGLGGAGAGHFRQFRVGNPHVAVHERGAEMFQQLGRVKPGESPWQKTQISLGEGTPLTSEDWAKALRDRSPEKWLK